MIVKTVALEGHREAVRCLSCLSETIFVSGALDGSVVLWSAHNLGKMRVLNQRDVYVSATTHMFLYSVAAVTVSESLMVIASGHGFLLVCCSVFCFTESLTLFLLFQYNWHNGALLASVPNAHALTVTSLLLLENGTRLLTAAVDGIRLWLCFFFLFSFSC